MLLQTTVIDPTVIETTVSQTAGVAATTASLVSNFDWSSPSWDLFLILFFVVGALLYGMSLGRDRIIVILVALYMGLAVVQALPNAVLTVGLDQVYAFKLTAFVSVFVVLFFLLSRSALLRTIGANASEGRWWQTIIFSILHVGLLLSIVLSYLPPEGLSKFSPLTIMLFTKEWGRFGWIVAPVVFMLLIKPDDD